MPSVLSFGLALDGGVSNRLNLVLAFYAGRRTKKGPGLQSRLDALRFTLTLWPLEMNGASRLCHHGVAKEVTLKPTAAWLIDMDGVLVREEHAIDGAGRFIGGLEQRGIPFLVLTNNSMYTRRDLAARLVANGVMVPEESIWTSALATARFLANQRPSGSAYVIGEAGLTTALYEAGYTQTDRAPDYVVLGETRTYSFERITTAVRLIRDGARFIATNPDPTGPSAEGPLPATGSVAALISHATGTTPYFVGKPNPLMIRTALNRLGAHSETTTMIGDRMDTDVLAGLESGLQTVLVLSGVTQSEDIERHPYRPTRVVTSVAVLADELDELEQA